MCTQKADLKKVMLGSNQISDEGMEQIAKLVQRSPLLFELNVTGKKSKRDKMSWPKPKPKPKYLQHNKFRVEQRGGSLFRKLSEPSKEERKLAEELAVRRTAYAQSYGSQWSGNHHANTDARKEDDESSVSSECSEQRTGRSTASANSSKSEDVISESEGEDNDKILEDAHISWRGARLIASVVQTHPAMQTLCLAHQRLGNKGAAAIATCLLHNSTLTSLQLGFCNIGCSGGLAFGLALQKNSALQHLDLQGNKLADEAFTAQGRGLSEAVRNCKSLSLLDIGRNKPGIGVDGCRSIANALLDRPPYFSVCDVLFEDAHGGNLFL